jgi:alpha-N-arabinofuranosidase
VQLTQRAGKATNGSARVVATAPLPSNGSGPLFLRIVARGAQYDFYYATAPDAWQLLKGDMDGTILSTKVAQGFVGVMFGMYAYAATP